MITSLAAAASQAALASSNGTASASSSGTATTNTALAQLGANFNQFLTLLMTQLRNQDPTQPMDSSQFTTELVQFTGVQEQVNTNTSLGQLIQLTQGSQLLQSSQVAGKVATVAGNGIALQSGTGTITFQGSAGEPVEVAVVNGAGQTVKTGTITAQAGTNSWVWNGSTDAGGQAPDGAYRLGLVTPTANNQTAPVTYSTVGTVTGLTSNAGTLMLDMGALAVPVSTLQSLGG